MLLTPHVGGSTEEAQESIGEEVAAKLIKYSNNGSTLSAVNFPEVSLPEHPGKHRLLHIHRNQPGVLSRAERDFLGGGDQYRGGVFADGPEDRVRGDRRGRGRAWGVAGVAEADRRRPGDDPDASVVLRNLK